MSNDISPAVSHSDRIATDIDAGAMTSNNKHKTRLQHCYDGFYNEKTYSQTRTTLLIGATRLTPQIIYIVVKFVIVFQ